MHRVVALLLFGLFFVPLAGDASAAPPAGNWKVFLPLGGTGDDAPWLVKFSEKDGKWSGEILATAQGVPPSKLLDVKVAGGKLSFTLDLTQVKFEFQGDLPKEAGKKIRGAFKVRGRYAPGELEATTLTSLDNYELQKNVLATKSEGIDVIRAAFVVIQQASERKATADDVKKWADKAHAASKAYGPFSDTVLLDLAETLSEQKPYAGVAVDYAQRAEKALGKDAAVTLQKRALKILATALTAAGKVEEAKKVEARNNELPWVETTKYAGRKARSDRVVLVELFTGAQCPPCVAADLAFDSLATTYKPTEVVLLQYHLHIPGPDPLTNPNTEKRAEFYGRAVRGTPAVFFNGKTAAPGGGGQDAAQDKYGEFLGVINPLLETPAKAKLELSASKKDDAVSITAKVSELGETGPDVRLRIALVEKIVNYTGANRLPQHHHVVRDFPGGIEGLPLKEKTATKEATVNLAELRKSLEKYLTDYNKDNPFPTKDRPLALKDLEVVAFVQNDETGEILQAAKVEVGEKK